MSSARGRSRQPASRRPRCGSTTTRAKKPVGWLELAKLEPPRTGAASESASPPPVEIYARTERTVGWVKLNAGTQLVADAQKLISEQ